MGREIPPTSIAPKASPMPGKNRPSARPSAMARMIHAGSQRSRNDIRACGGAGCVGAVTGNLPFSSMSIEMKATPIPLGR